MKVICFGDSNTYGYCNEGDSADPGERFNEEERWTRLLQKKLGDDYLVIEEGLNGRTTCFEDPLREGLKGLDYISPCLRSHAPIDKLIIMLGTNDIALYGVDGTMERWEIFIDRIVEKNPDIQIYIQSCTPVHLASEYNKLNNDIIDEYNVQLELFCQENGYHFVNIAPYFKDFRNSLVGEYCSDARMHITYDGALIWEYALKAYGEEQLRNMEGEDQ